MIKQTRSRYFVYSRVNPSQRDMKILQSSLKAIRADYHGIMIQGAKCGPIKKRRTLLQGFFVLSKDSTYAANLESWFPNFLIRQMPVTFDLDTDIPQSMLVKGIHPYASCKRNLLQDMMDEDESSESSSVIIFDNKDKLFDDSLYPYDEK